MDKMDQLFTIHFNYLQRKKILNTTQLVCSLQLFAEKSKHKWVRSQLEIIIRDPDSILYGNGRRAATSGINHGLLDRPSTGHGPSA